jgi:phage gp36-like protein
MTDYAGVSDMVARFGTREMIQLTDRSSPPADQIDATVAQPALDSARSLIDGYVGAKYALPLLSAPPLLTDLCCDIARYRLFADQAPEIVKDRHAQAIRTLEGISRGTVKIDAAGVEPPPRSDVIETSGDPRRFSRHKLARF